MKKQQVGTVLSESGSESTYGIPEGAVRLVIDKKTRAVSFLCAGGGYQYLDGDRYVKVTTEKTRKRSSGAWKGFEIVE